MHNNGSIVLKFLFEIKPSAEKKAGGFLFLSVSCPFPAVDGGNNVLLLANIVLNIRFDIYLCNLFRIR